MNAVLAMSPPLATQTGWSAIQPHPLRAELDRLRQDHAGTLHALAQATRRAERAERSLRSRLLQRAWPTTLGGLTGGFTAVVALRLAGF